MKELKQQIELLSNEELERASAKFGAVNNSDHESYAILKEEFEEAKEEIYRIKYALKEFWKSTKENDAEYAKITYLEGMKEFAINASAEMVQVAAMAQKAINTIEERGKNES